MDIKREIGQRLREFGERKFKTMAAFAKSLGIEPQNLNAYLSGIRIPGNKLKDKLQAMGCDIIYLEHGKTVEQINDEFDKSRIGRGLKYNEEQFRILEYLAEQNITTLNEVKKRITTYDKVSAVILKASEPSPIKYSTTKKRRKEK